MARYYFHLRTDSGREDDTEGAEFPSVDAAKAEASRAAREMLSDRVWSGQALFADAFEIATEEGIVVATVPFKSVARLN
ncbi:hypothetical protein QO002_006232 [Pararhizobium capsulatum DSM 1112]|uniref:DUF6894 domain-containing protein n=1 Tax=Pararhizobium capsulatum DSM 1112 TaxID=1121113 RepID=A0ABU0C0L5_9HYPH|nr:hypothetical protein [Pararhizobium capsulatum]MDQ0324025.1 hypothetical protein [Pararhizobium capsulatum DSM 1112]